MTRKGEEDRWHRAAPHEQKDYSDAKPRRGKEEEQKELVCV